MTHRRKRLFHFRRMFACFDARSLKSISFRVHEFRIRSFRVFVLRHKLLFMSGESAYAFRIASPQPPTPMSTSRRFPFVRRKARLFFSLSVQAGRLGFFRKPGIDLSSSKRTISSMAWLKFQATGDAGASQADMMRPRPKRILPTNRPKSFGHCDNGHPRFNSIVPAPHE